MVSESKVIRSKYRYEIIAMIRGKWPLRMISDWLSKRGETISVMSLSRYRQKHIPLSDLLPSTYFENRCKELEIRLIAMQEHAKAIHVQKERCSLIFEQERAHSVVFPEGRKEMTLLNQMIVDHKRMEDGITTGTDDKDKVIELRWMDDDDKDDEQEFTTNENGKQIRNRGYKPNGPKP